MLCPNPRRHPGRVAGAVLGLPLLEGRGRRQRGALTSTSFLTRFPRASQLHNAPHAPCDVPFQVPMLIGCGLTRLQLDAVPGFPGKILFKGLVGRGPGGKPDPARVRDRPAQGIPMAWA